MSEALDVGRKLVAACKQGDFLGPYSTLYSEKITSVEGADMPGMPATQQGLAAVKAKGEWWEANHVINSAEVTGPFVGLRPDQFVVKYDLDVTDKESSQRNEISEVAIYTVEDGMIVREEFLYLMG